MKRRMLRLSLLTRRRGRRGRTRRSRGAKAAVRPALLRAALAGAVGVVLATAAALVLPVLLCRGPACPSVDALRTYEPPEASRVFAMDGSVIADLAPQRRTVVRLEEVSPLLRDGVIAVEDRRFWEHQGVDPVAFARAALRNALSLSFREGFSTIDMQLARNVFPEALPLGGSVRRKLWEVLLALDMEDELAKEQILELYLNQIYMGDGLYGVEAAAQAYLGTSAAELGPAQAALLIGIIRTPERYNPRKHPTRALQRRNLVLDVMVREGVLSEEQAARARSSPVRLAPPYESAGPAPYFVAAVRRELRERFGPDADTRGLRVFTGLDPVVQRAAHRALERQIERVEAGALGEYAHPRPDGPFAPAPGSSPYLQGMVLALDAPSGGVRALVGGRDFAHSQFDRALQARRQPGSAFKPIVYAAALERGLPPTARISTAAVAVETAGSGTWRPGDHVRDSSGTLAVREAVARSSNSAAVRVGQWVGEERVVSMARRLGIHSGMHPYPSIHLGAAELVPAELVAAFAPFGNGGFRVEPRLIERVEDADGRILWRAPARRERVLESGVAFLGLSLLEDVVDRGTGSAVRREGFWLPAAGKTGTTNEAKDVWFVGLTPELVAGVWLGFDRPKRILAGATGGSVAAPVWADMMKEVYADRPTGGGWTPPRDVVGIPVDERTGLVATRRCPPGNVRVEYFLPGTEPISYCDLHPDGSGRFFDRLWKRVQRVF